MMAVPDPEAIDTVVADIQCEDLEMATNLNIGTNGNLNDNKIVFGCIAKGCDFSTAKYDSELMAYKLLTLHVGVLHKRQQYNEKLNVENKIWAPELLSLDPSEDCEEEFSFWLNHFYIYLQECSIDKETEMYSKLKSRLSFKIYQCVCDSQDFNSLVTALQKLYVKK